MYGLPDLLSRASKRQKEEALDLMITYPRTSALQEQMSPLATFEFEGGTLLIDWAALASQVEKHPELIAVRAAREEVKLMLEVLRGAFEFLHLEQFDNIQICNVVGLVRLVNSPIHTGRSACIDVNSFRSRLQTLLSPEKAPVDYPALILVSIVGTAVAVLAHRT